MRSSIVRYVEIDKELFRLEAEYYNSGCLMGTKYFTGEEIIDFVQYGTSKSLNEEGQGYPTLRLNEFDSFFIGKPKKHCIKIDEYVFRSLSLQKGDVLICRTNGNPKFVGKSAIVPEDHNYAFASYLFRVRPDHNKILPTTLVVYLNSNAGRTEIEKNLMISNQANFSPAKFREILVPKFRKEIQNLIDSCVWKAFEDHKRSINRYNQAQIFLLYELALTKWQPKHRLWFVKNYSDTEQAERIDADYFQPKYEEIVNAIKGYSGGYSFIKDEFKQNKSTFEIDAERTYRYVEIGSVNVSNGEISPSVVAGAELPANAKRVLKKDDVIVSKVRTYRGAVTIVEKNGYVGSGAFTILRENGRIKKETLLAFLHSKPLLAWSLKPNSGTSYPVIIDNDILNLPVPLLPEEIQIEIQQKVIESFKLRKQSKHLLECAKRAVEMAIEQDEQRAINWLKIEINAMQI